MYTKVNLTKAAGITPGSAAQKNQIVLVDVEDIASFPDSDANGVKLVGTPVLKPGGKFISIYSTKSKTEAPFETDGDEDMMNFAAKFIAQHPGNRLEVKEFVQNWTGRDIIVFHKSCADDFWEVMGTPCAPLQLKASKQDNNDGRFYNLTFEPFAKSGFVPKHYEGDISFTEPFAVVSVADVDVTPANGIQYKLPSLAVTDAIEFGDMTVEHGTMISLIGSGGVAPATLVDGVSGSATVLLKTGITWTALNNAVIHLQVFKTAATTYLIEMSRG
jgi:hypothetical protein